MPEFAKPNRTDLGQTISKSWLNKITDQVLASIRVSGAGKASRIGNTLVIKIDERQSRPYRMIRITGSTATGVNDANGNPVQWTYTAQEVSLRQHTYGGWGVVTNGWSGSAFNLAEIENSGTGRQVSNGVDHDGADYPAGFTMKPIQIGMYVPAIIRTVDNGSGSLASAAWFWPIPNGEDGTCTLP